MFEKKEYIVSSSFGICMVEKVTKLTVGRERQMEYYVLQSPADKSKKSYIPVEHHETILRRPMEEERAKNILDAMVINGKEMQDSARITFEEAKELLESGEPEQWKKGAEYYLLHEYELDRQLSEIMEKMWENLLGELAFVLKKSKEDIRQMIINRIK